MPVRRGLRVAFLSGVLLCGAPAAAGDPPANDFATLVKRAEKAQRANDPVDAVKAYRDALKLHHDPTIAGRLGILLGDLQHFDLAATYLHDAVETPSSSVTEFEYARFARAYKAAQQKVCRVDVTIDRRGARLEVDGKLQQEGKGEYWFFAVPGEHTLRVSLEGFEDETRTITVERGGRLEMDFSMRPLPKPEPIAAPPEARRQVNAADPPPLQKDEPSPKTNPSAKGRFVLGAGAVLVLGATPTPALGPQIFGAWRSRSWWEVGVELRAGWTFVEADQFPDTRFVTWSATLAPCGRWRDRWFACGLVQFDGGGRNDSPKGTFLLGLGLRAGVEMIASERLRLQAWADAAAHPGAFRFQGKAEWEGTFVTGTFGMRATYTFF